MFIFFLLFLNLAFYLVDSVSSFFLSLNLSYINSHLRQDHRKVSRTLTLIFHSGSSTSNDKSEEQGGGGQLYSTVQKPARTSLAAKSGAMSHDNSRSRSEKSKADRYSKGADNRAEKSASKSVDKSANKIDKSAALKWEEAAAAAAVVGSSEDDEVQNFKRTPRPPIRRRNRSTPAAPRPKSTPSQGEDARNSTSNISANKR